MTECDDHNAQGVVQRFYGGVAPSDARLTRAPGGMSGATVWRVSAPVSAGGREERGRAQRCWALRRWPAGASAEAILWSHRVLAHAVGRGADFVPAPLAGIDGSSLFTLTGRQWELAPWMPGEPLPEDGAEESLLAMARALRGFHDAAGSFPPGEDSSDGFSSYGPPPSLADRLRRLADAEQTDWRRVAAGAASTPGGRDSSGTIRVIGASLHEAIAQAHAVIAPVADARTALQPVIRDARRQHFLFTGGRVTGLVDFGAMSVDTVALDLARLLGESGDLGPQAWRAALDAYDPPTDSRRLVMPLAVSGAVLAAANWLRWMAEGRPAPADRLERLGRQVERIAARGLPPT